MTSATPYDTHWANLPPEQQLQSLAERKLGKNQIELGLYLMSNLVIDAAHAVSILETISEFNANKRAASEGSEKRVPVAQQIIQALEADRDEVAEDEKMTASAIFTYDRCISVAGRFV